MDHVLHKNSLDRKKCGLFKKLIIKCIKIRLKNKLFYFATVTVRKLNVFEIYNRPYFLGIIFKIYIFWLKHPLE